MTTKKKGSKVKVTNPVGAPSTYTIEKADEICNMISRGSNINKITDMEGFPTAATIYNWFEKHPDFLSKYMRAREARANWRADRVDDVLSDMRAGIIDYNQARIEIDAIKWQTGKESPKMYGDSTTIKGDADNPLEFNLAVRLDRALIQLKEAKGKSIGKIIEHEPLPENNQ